MVCINNAFMIVTNDRLITIIYKANENSIDKQDKKICILFNNKKKLYFILHSSIRTHQNTYQFPKPNHKNNRILRNQDLPYAIYE